MIACLFLAVLLTTGRQVRGQGEWADGFGLPGLSGTASALTVFDDGSGPALYAGGDFTVAGGVSTNFIAKWNPGAPGAWSPLGSGMDYSVFALTVFDDGTGPALYAGGAFTTAGGVSANNIAKWNGSGWSALPGAGAFRGMNGEVDALTVFDDGTGPALYAGGGFTTAGGVSANFIAKWNGSAWSALGSGMNGIVRALSVFDDGTGASLYAGGGFTTAGKVSASNIAKWNGSGLWSPLGSGTNSDVLALTVFDDGTGLALYAGGHFFTAGVVSANRIAKWNGSAWSPLGNGLGSAVALTVFDDGTGPALYAGSLFQTFGGGGAGFIAKWNGLAWFPLGSGMNDRVRALTVFDDGTGPALYAGGDFTTAGGVSANGIAKWNGSAWSALSDTGPFSGMNGSVFALTVFDDGTGSALYAGGAFTTAGGVSARRIAKWNGSGWSALPGAGAFRGMNGEVDALTVFDDGTGPALYAGGEFTVAGGVSANRIAKWNPGAPGAWSPLGSGMTGSFTDNFVLALTVFDDGTGPALYAGGEFTVAGGVSANGIAKWNGSGWFPLGSGMNGSVHALTVFNDGTGPALYAGGFFTTDGGASVNFIAKWNGSAWSPLGSGIDSYYYVDALTVFDDGTGPALYAGGWFTTGGGVSANNIAKWNGSAWSPLGSGMDSDVYALTVFDDGTGPGLYAGGLFTTAGGLSAKNIAKWDGSTWSPLGSGMNSRVDALTVFDDGTGSALYAGGIFTTAGGKPSASIAAWRLPLIGDCDGNDEVGLGDARFFADCLTGPAVAVDALGACRCADLNGDGFVDLRDAALLMQLFGASR